MRPGITALFVCVLGCASLRAETWIIPVVGKGWQITFDGPVPAMESTQPNEQGLVYRANAGLFNLSVFVEVPAGSGGDSKACRDFYWLQASKNPMIQKDTVKQWSAPACECVEYQIAGETKDGKKFKQANINCYFAHEGRWVDVHASVMTPTEADQTLLKNLAQSLTRGPFPDFKGGLQTFTLGDLGQLQIDVPAAWRVGHMSAAKNTGLPDQNTLSFYSSTDPNKSWKMTFFKSSVRYKTLKDIQQAAQNAQQSLADGSVEHAVNLQEIKLKQGVGCQAVYTDATLVDKPVQAGNAKVLSSGLVAPMPDVLGTITISADDAKDPDFLRAIQALGTMEWVSGKAPTGKE